MSSASAAQSSAAPAVDGRGPGAGEGGLVEPVDRGGQVGGGAPVRDGGVAQDLGQVGPRRHQGGQPRADGVGHLPGGEVGPALERQCQHVDGGQPAVVDLAWDLVVREHRDAGVVVGGGLAVAAQHQQLDVVAGAGVDAVDEQLGVLARPGRPDHADPQAGGRQPELGLGGGAVDLGAGRHQRAPVAVRDDAVDGGRREVVPATDGLLAPVAVVDHGRGRLGPRAVEGGVVGRGVGREVVLRPHDGDADVTQGLGHPARPAGRHAGQPLGPVQVQHVDGGERVRQPVGVVEQVVGHGPDVDPVAERGVEALVVPVVVRGRRRPAASG